ncbi:MAG: preprotein translocase subunit SecY [Legionellales bacterium]|nr:preprotein translocase subunit SecY [Legionellales bacterium]
MTNASQLAEGSRSGLAELWQRLLFVVIGILIFRIGAHIPVPGLDPAQLAAFFRQNSNGMIGYFNMFSGGALKRFTVFALGVMPYISASIIIQLMSAVMPSLEQLKKEGESGKRKINQYTRYATLFLAFFQSLGFALYLAKQHIALDPTIGFYFNASLTLTAGTLFLMWLGEQITERGVGNGISLIIFAGIVSALPSAIGRTLEQVREGQMQFFVMLLVLAVILFVTGFVVFMERAQRKITINYAKRQQGRKVFAAQTSHLPLKINMAGVIPPIFASAIIMFPVSIAQFFGGGTGSNWLSDIAFALMPGQPLYLVVYTFATVFFCFFYTALVFNPKDTADNLKKSGAFIPGIRPGEQTARYIDSVMTRLTAVGSIYLVLVALFPEFLMLMWNVPFYFGGTSLLIIVVVLMDFIAQIQAHIMSQRYESLLKKANLKNSGSSNLGLLR